MIEAFGEVGHREREIFRSRRYYQISRDIKYKAGLVGTYFESRVPVFTNMIRTYS